MQNWASRRPMNRTTKPMKRSAIKRRAPAVAQSDPAIFEIVTKDGDAYLWPIRHMEEVKEWMPTVIDWAHFGDPATKHWHANQTQRSDEGFFDVMILQPTRGKALMVETKVRDRAGEAKQPTTAQWSYIYAAIACGWDARVWLWPDDAREAYETLTPYSYDAFKVGRTEVRS